LSNIQDDIRLIEIMEERRKALAWPEYQKNCREKVNRNAAKESVSKRNENNFIYSLLNSTKDNGYNCN
jgi:hypothetical protein